MILAAGRSPSSAIEGIPLGDLGPRRHPPVGAATTCTRRVRRRPSGGVRRPSAAPQLSQYLIHNFAAPPRLSSSGRHRQVYARRIRPSLGNSALRNWHDGAPSSLPAVYRSRPLILCLRATARVSAASRRPNALDSRSRQKFNIRPIAIISEGGRR